MKATNDRAFKEWAVVVRAMERGETCLLIRKGGIFEEGGDFHVNDPEFHLYPNHTHQNPYQLQERAHRALVESDSEEPPAGMIRISSYAAVAEVFTIPDEAALARLSDEHLWTEEYVRDRLHYKPDNPLFGIVLRVYRLPEEVGIPYHSSYSGCTSWITLQAPIATAGAVPALDDAAFTERLNRIRALRAGRYASGGRMSATEISASGAARGEMLSPSV